MEATHEKATRRSPSICCVRISLLDDRLQFALGIAVRHRLQRDRLDLGSLASAAERFVTRLADLLHRLGGYRQEFARIEVLGIFREIAAHRAGRCHAKVGVDIDLAHAVLDAFDDLLGTP